MNAPTEVKKREHYPMFDVLRLVLAVAVVFMHMTAWAGVRHGDGFDFVLPMVPCFLALSGFMVLASRESSRNAMHFWQKRVLRIVPAFLISLGIVAAAFGIASLPHTLTPWWTLGIVAYQKYNGALWSLSWEELLYVVMAVLWAMGAYRSKFAIWCLFLASLVLLLRINSTSVVYYRIISLPFCFFLGNLWYLYRDKVTQYGKWSLVFVAIALVAQSLQSTEYFGFPIRVTASCLACLTMGLAFTGRSWLKADISYGIYIYHYPILFALRDRFGLTLALWVLGPACILGWSLLSYYLIEKPALRLKNWRPARRLAPAPIPSPQET